MGEARTEGCESLATRERGLKLCRVRECIAHSESLATRERGLKQCREILIAAQQKSLATRERGLKQPADDGFIGQLEVARHTRAWIETFSVQSSARVRMASLATRERGLKRSGGLAVCLRPVSLATRERGLKLLQ